MAAQIPALEHPEIDRNLFAEIHRICREGCIDQLRELLNYEKDILNYFHTRTLKGYTLLHETVEAAQPDVVQLLLLYGVSPNIRARGGVTPLQLAAAKTHVGCVRALLDSGADITLKDDLGHDAMFKAEQRSSKKREMVVKFLRSKGIVWNVIHLFFVHYEQKGWGLFFDLNPMFFILLMCVVWGSFLSSHTNTDPFMVCRHLIDICATAIDVLVLS